MRELKPRRCIIPKCGKIFQPTTPNHRRCGSRKDGTGCAGASRHVKAKPKVWTPRPKIDKICGGCDNEFTPSRADQQTCSQECKKKITAEKNKQRYVEEVLYQPRKLKPRDHWCDFAGNRPMNEKLQEDFKHYQGLFNAITDIKTRFKYAKLIKVIRDKYNKLKEEMGG